MLPTQGPTCLVKNAHQGVGAPLLALSEKGPAEPPTSPPAHPRPPRSTSLYRPGSQTLLPCTLQTRGLRPFPALAFLPTPRNREQQRIRAIVREISFEFAGPNQAFPVVALSHRDSVFDSHGGIDLLRRRPAEQLNPPPPLLPLRPDRVPGRWPTTESCPAASPSPCPVPPPPASDWLFPPASFSGGGCPVLVSAFFADTGRGF